ncbi:MAG TPA: ABC transporter substrate-binding protein [Burkholderiales bacterium]|nr:ABC transporter substrate-binding protein [Burkholderiales bacterium]
MSAGECVAQSAVVDASGREIRPPAKVERVYAAGPPASMLVFAIAPDKLTGWTRAMRPSEAQYLPERYAALPELGRLTGRGNTANVEVVLRAKTDLIADVGSTGPSLASLATQVQAQTRIPYALLDGRIESTPATLRALGKLMGNEAQAEKLAAWYERELADAKQRVSRAGEHPLVYYGRSPSGLQTGGKGSINVEALDFLGARNAAAEARAGLVTVSFEQVILWDPEVILTTDPNFWKSVWSDPRWRAVKAVAAKRVYLSPHLPFGWFDFPPGANRLLGVWWAGKLLYPKEFDLDLRAKVTEFHRLFYHQEPSAAQLDALLGEPGVLPK